MLRPALCPFRRIKHGALWLGTNKLGLVKLTPDRKQAVWYQSNPDDPNGLGGDLVVGLLRDRDGSFWATTKAGDVHRFQPQRPVFRSYRHQRGNPHSLDEGSVTAAYVEDRDTLWIGTDRGLNRVDRRTDQVTRYDEPVFRRGVRAIAKDRRGNLWFGTRGNGLVRFDPRSGRYKTYAHVPSDPRSLSYDNIDALWIDRRGTLVGRDGFWPEPLRSERPSEFRRYSPQPKESDPVSLDRRRTGRCAVAGNLLAWPAPFRSTHGHVHDLRARGSATRIVSAIIA